MFPRKIGYFLTLLLVMHNVLSENNNTTTKKSLRSNSKPSYNPEHMDALYRKYARMYEWDTSRDAEDKYIAFGYNVVAINRLNSFYQTATFAINKYTNLPFDGFNKGYTGFNGTGLTDDNMILFNRSIVQSYPPKMDWSETLEQYHQEDACKMSYVFSALSNIEAQFVAQNGFQSPGYLSVRQAFECEKQGSCEYGGVPHNVFQALKDTGGVSVIHEYPYFEGPNDKKSACQTKSVTILIDRYLRLKVDQEEDLLYLLAFYGPVVTTIYVSQSIRHYSSGVLDPGDCGDNATNHAVLLDGYGIDEATNLPYWHVKNSWASWGEDNHIKLIRGKGFVCNLGREYIATTFVTPAHPEYLRQNKLAEKPSSKAKRRNAEEVMYDEQARKLLL